MPGGAFTDHVFNTMKERDILRFEAPLGTFFLREDSVKPVVLLASGTGFAPLKAIVEHAVFKNITRPMTLYWARAARKTFTSSISPNNGPAICRGSASSRCCRNPMPRTTGPDGPASFIAR